MESAQSHVSDASGRPSHAWSYILGLIIALAMVGLGIAVAITLKSWALLAAGGVSVVGVLVVWPIHAAIGRREKQDGAADQKLMSGLSEALARQSALLEMIGEQQLLSDRAKAIAFREKDREALRRAVEEEIGREDWESAMLLAGEIEKQFGNRQEADRFRQQIVQGRRQIVRRQVDQALEAVEQAIRAEQWAQARREADKIAAAFPEDEQARQLPLEVHNRQQQYKQLLLENWRAAVARKDTDGGIELLKQLDAYLTPAEAESLQETARTVFKDKLNSLRLEFTAAVQADHWQQALEIAQSITTDFPNTRIAQEVGEKMNALRQRAAKEPAAT